MTKRLEIRRFQRSDSKQAQQVHERSLEASPIEAIENAPPIRGVPLQYIAEGGEFLVGTLDGDVVAIGGFSTESETTVELQRIRVDPDHQRKGYGERIVTELEARACNQGFERIILDTDERLTAARQLYRKLGYENVSQVEQQYSDPGTVCFEKEIVETI